MTKTNGEDKFRRDSVLHRPCDKWSLQAWQAATKVSER